MKLIWAWLLSKNSLAPFLVVSTNSADEDIRRLKFLLLTHKIIFIKEDNMRFLLIFAFMVLAKNNNGTESCNVVRKEMQHYPEGTYILTYLCKIKRYFYLIQAVKIPSRPVPWQDFELVPFPLDLSFRSKNDKAYFLINNQHTLKSY